MCSWRAADGYPQVLPPKTVQNISIAFKGMHPARLAAALATLDVQVLNVRD